MDQELKELMEKQLAATQETNRLLRAANRHAWIGSIAKVVLWVAIIVISIYSVAALMGPYLEMLQGATSNGYDFSQFEDLLDQYRTGN